VSPGSFDPNQYDSFIIHALNLEGDNHTNGWVVPSIDGWSWDGKSLTVLSPELSSANHGINTSGAPLNGHLNKFEVTVTGDATDYGISTDDSDAQFTVSAESIVVSATGHGIYGSTEENKKHHIEMTDFQTLVISGGNSGNGGAGIVINKRGEVLLHSEKPNSQINVITSTRLYDHDAAISNKTAYDTTSDAVSKIDLKADTIIVNKDAGRETGYNGIYSGENNFSIGSKTYIDSQINLTGKDIQVYGAYFGVIQNGKGTVRLNAENGTNLVKLTDQIDSKGFLPSAIRVNGAQDKLGKVELQAQTNIVNGYDGDGIAIYSEGYSNVVLTATNVNEVQGVVISGVRPTEEQQPSNVLSNISFNGNTNLVSSYLVEHKYEDSDSNYQYALGVLSMSEGLIKYEEGSTVSLKTHFNEVDNDEQSIRERLVWASGGGEVNLDKTQLSAVTQNGMSFDNSVGIALVASDGGKVNARNLMTGSRIVGDIVGGIGGYVDLSLDRGNGTYVRRDTAATDADIRGNALAANGGRVDMSLGSGSVWLGRADDYRDAAQADQTWSGVHTEFFTPQFSDRITSSGTVNITLERGAIWAITGQSWVTTLAGEGGIIDLSGGTDTNSHALRVWNVQGSHTFVLDLNHLDHTTSDMLYLKTQEVSALAFGNDRSTPVYVQNIILENIQGLEEMAPGTQIRFATVDGNIAFKPYGVEGTANVVQISDQGLVNSGFVIGSEAYDPNNNDNYNGSKPEGDATKPGDAWTDSAFGNGTNWYLTRDPSKDTVSDAGKTVLSLSKANYSTAVYMDTLNKRQGEARFGTGQDEGLWVRLRYDDIEKVDAFTSSNTMTEIGYDLKVESDNGVHRRGIAVDYMNGSLDYSGVRGSGDIERLGAWLYNTWIGNDGHYTDIVLKWGHLDNDFDVLAPSTLQTISGGYTNDVFSASVEYGYRWMDENSNYIEPQVQFQYSYVTDADYTTSQASKVKLDSINSYIARVGFRAGHHWENDKDIYLKFDLLHEFDGEQRVRASDKGGKFDFTIDNDGTWADFGVGFSMKMDNDSYFFIDAEKIIGNDYGSTYQVSGGIRINF
jgi:outer membrane autotransporter protein